jgi:predicted nucleic acid-binding protein
VTRHILLDSAPLGLLSNPVRTVDVTAISDWVTDCLAAGHKIYIPEVIDYEIRRELLRAGKTTGIARLDQLQQVIRYLPLHTKTMLLAADLWAQSRRGGYPTGDPKKLDIDVILAAQTLTLAVSVADVIVATSNVNHLSRFVLADLWKNIIP